MPLPHCAAIFWGDRLTVVHNLAWQKARGRLDGQGTTGHDSYSGEAIGALTKVLRGRTVKVGKHRTTRGVVDVCSSSQPSRPP